MLCLKQAIHIICRNLYMNIKYNFLPFISQWRNDSNLQFYRCSVAASNNNLL